MSACAFQETLAVSRVYRTASSEGNTRINRLAPASSTYFSVERIKLVAEGLLKLLKPKTICFSIDSKRTWSSQDDRGLTPLFPVPSFASPN